MLFVGCSSDDESKPTLNGTTWIDSSHNTGMTFTFGETDFTRRVVFMGNPLYVYGTYEYTPPTVTLKWCKPHSDPNIVQEGTVRNNQLIIGDRIYDKQ